MHNHGEKARDMARSALASAARVRARARRAQVREAERADERRLVYDLRTLDPDDHDGDLSWRDRAGLERLLGERRSADKLSPLLRWAEAVVRRDPRLRCADHRERVVRFRALLPPGVDGRHALAHLDWVLGGTPLPWPVTSPVPPAAPPVAPLVAGIVAAGLHGELNRRIRAACPATDERRRIRFLAGAHDVTAFASEADAVVRRVVCELYEQEVGPARLSM